MDWSMFDHQTKAFARRSRTASRRSVVIGAIAAAAASFQVGGRTRVEAAQQCEDPLLDCGGSCVDPQTDTFHCGACGIACTGVPGPGQSSIGQCANGQCVAVCLDDADVCDGECTDLLWDFRNCGSCGNPCAGEQICCDGRCIGPADADRFCGDCGLQGGWPQGCADSEVCDGAICAAVSQPTIATSELTLEELQARVIELEQRVVDLEAERIPIDPGGPDFSFDYTVDTHDDVYQFGLACTIEEPATSGMALKLNCIRPIDLQ